MRTILENINDKMYPELLKFTIIDDVDGTPGRGSSSVLQFFTSAPRQDESLKKIAYSQFFKGAFPSADTEFIAHHAPRTRCRNVI